MSVRGPWPRRTESAPCTPTIPTITAWAWFLGPLALAHHRVHGNREAALALLAPIAQHLADAGVGSVSEIFDGDAPHAPGGCPFQAWSVGEVLRAYSALAR
jgi:glycogen debranching enzyme